MIRWTDLPENDEAIDVLIAKLTDDTSVGAQTFESDEDEELYRSLEWTAAAIDLAMQDEQETSMPETLAERIETAILRTKDAGHGLQLTGSEAGSVVGSEIEINGPVGATSNGVAGGADTAGRIGPIAWAGWATAAACIGIAAFAWNNSGGVGAPERLSDTLAARDVVIAKVGTSDRAVRWDWMPSDEGFEGDVVWDSDGQVGYMRFEGLEANDPDDYQYQLWIFDAERGPESIGEHAHPVDGGVFDVTDEGEVVVEIAASLPVDRPFGFVVTRERPGGVVVSDRQRIAAIAVP